MTLHTLRGLNDRDLTLVAAACADRANLLTHIAAGHHDDSTVNQASYDPGNPRPADLDAERLRFIAATLHRHRRRRIG